MATSDKKSVSAAENQARKDVLTELFSDFNSSKSQIYWLNFFRGIFFGVGSVIGGTLVVALALTILNLMVDIPGGFGDAVQYIVNTVESR